MNGRPRRPYNGNRPFERQQQRAPQRGQTYDSNGPGVRIRGSANQIFERYVALAREAAIGGDPVAAENLYQHAEHYFRIASAHREGSQQRTVQPTAPADVVDTQITPESNEPDSESTQPGWGDDRPGFI